MMFGWPYGSTQRMPLGELSAEMGYVLSFLAISRLLRGDLHIFIAVITIIRKEATI